MIAHVAERSEARGRVVLQLCAERPSAIAIDAAIKIARAFQSEVESLFVENQQLIELAGYPFAREISFNGRTSRPITGGDIERDMRFAFASVQRRIEACARDAEVPVRQRVVRGNVVDALAAACAEFGPWNIIVLAAPLTSPGCPPLDRLFNDVSGSTGLILVGPHAQQASGDIVLVVEDIDRLPGMLRAADRIAALDSRTIQVLLIAPDDVTRDVMEGEARLLLGERADIQINSAVFAPGAQAAVAETLRKIEAEFMFAQYGGFVVPRDGNLRPLALSLRCPLLLVR